jgi:hypothetical protein
MMFWICFFPVVFKVNAFFFKPSLWALLSANWIGWEKWVKVQFCVRIGERLGLGFAAKVPRHLFVWNVLRGGSNWCMIENQNPKPFVCKSCMNRPAIRTQNRTRVQGSSKCKQDQEDRRIKNAAWHGLTFYQENTAFKKESGHLRRHLLFQRRKVVMTGFWAAEFSFTRQSRLHNFFLKVEPSSISSRHTDLTKLWCFCTQTIGLPAH